jgi:hypothetical protein
MRDSQTLEDGGIEEETPKVENFNLGLEYYSPYDMKHNQKIL